MTNNRKTSGGYQSGTDTYNNSGQVVENNIGYENKRTWKFDAAGRMTDWLESLPYLVPGHYWDAGEAITFDGDGRSAKRVKRHRHRVYGTEGYVLQYEYKIISSVTGQTITELTETGAKLKTSIYMGGSAIASQHEWEETQAVSFTNTDPLTGSTQETSSAGEMPLYDTGHNEFEPLGALANPSEEEMTVPNYGKGGSIKNPESACTWNGAPIRCNMIASILRSETSWVMEINMRSEGGWGMAQGLSVWRYREYIKTPNAPDPPDTKDGDIWVDDDTHFLREWYEVYGLPLTITGGDDTYAGLRARRITDDEAVSFKKYMNDNLSGDCLGYIYQLMDQVAKNIGGTPVERGLGMLFDSVRMSRGATTGREPSGMWLYLERSPGSTGGANWEKNDLSVGLHASNTRSGLIENYFSSPEGLHHLVHELIHTSIKPFGASDTELAIAALQLSGETMDLSKVADEDKSTIASNIWDDRLSRACGWQGRVGLEKYIRKVK